MIRLLIIPITVILLFVSLPAAAQITVTPSNNALTLARKILGPGVTILNPQFTGHNLSAGTFSAAPGSFLLDSGIILSSGRAKTSGSIYGVDNPANSHASTSNNTPGNADLGLYASPNGTPLNTLDACILEFDFIPQGDSIYVRYIFGSEEYPDYNCATVNDAFAFIISGPGIFGKKNIALVPNAVGGGSVPVAINSINNGVPAGDINNCYAYGIGSPYTQYYIDNASSQTMVYDGHTVILTAKAKVIPCQVYHIKLAISDVGDRIFDSGVFLEASSFTSRKEINTSVAGPYTDPSNNNVTMIEACKTAQLTLTRAADVTGAFTIMTSYAGTATPNVDFTTDLTATVTFAANENQKTFNFTALADPLNEGLENIEVRFSKGTCASSLIDSAILYIRDSLVYRTSTDTSFCTATPITVTSRDPEANTTNSYLWNDGSTAQTLNITQPGTYYVTHTYSERCLNIDTFHVESDDPILNISNTTSAMCPGDSLILRTNTDASSFSWNTGHTTDSIVVHNGGQFWITATNAEGCSKSDTIDVTITPAPVVDLGVNIVMCEYDTAELNATYPGATYVWSTGATTPTILVSAQGRYSVVSTMNGCSATDTVDVTEKPTPVVNLGMDTAICETNTINLDATYTGASYSWNTGAVTASITVGTAGEYSVVNTLNGCTATDTINIAIQTAPVIELGEDTAICEYDTIQLRVTYPGAAYTWNTGATDSFINVNDEGVYAVTATMNGCSFEDSVAVSFKRMPVANAGIDLIIPTNSTAQLNAGQHADNAGYLWSPAGSLSDATIPNPIASPTAATEYTLYVTSVDGCIAEDKVMVRITFPLSIPNAFSPNGDNINDKWQITNLEFYPNSKVFVFNRYGQQVFLSEDYRTPWDGTQKGKPLAPGTYYYLIDIGEGRRSTGWVLLLR